MNCYVCAAQGRQQAAVSQCRNCDAGLCMEHLRVNAIEPGPGGLRYDCAHSLPATKAR